MMLNRTICHIRKVRSIVSVGRRSCKSTCKSYRYSTIASSAQKDERRSFENDINITRTYVPSSASASASASVICSSLHNGAGTNQMFKRWMSSSKNDGGENDEKDGEEEPLAINTPPLSELSPEDMNLAIQAVSEVDGSDGHGNDLNENAASPSSSSTTKTLNIDNIPGTSKGGSRKLAIIYTCNVCNTRSAKKFTERAYNHGVVLVRCPNCESLHLISDQLGFFSEKDENGRGWDIETFMKEIGKEDNIKVATEGKEVLEVTLEDVLGDKMKEIEPDQKVEK